MKFLMKPTFFPSLGTVVLLTGALSILPMGLPAAEPEGTTTAPGTWQRLFASPDGSQRTALQTAGSSQGSGGLAGNFRPRNSRIFPPPVTPRRTQTMLATLCAWSWLFFRAASRVKDGDDKMRTLEVGTNDWPMPIPLVRVWTGSGILTPPPARRRSSTGISGKDEIKAIGVCFGPTVDGPKAVCQPESGRVVGECSTR